MQPSTPPFLRPLQVRQEAEGVEQQERGDILGGNAQT